MQRNTWPGEVGPDAITCIGKASQSYRGTKLAFADAPTIGGTFGR